MLDDAGSTAALGSAMAWAERHGVAELHLLVESRGRPGPSPVAAGPAGISARRALFFDDPPLVWECHGRQLRAAEPAPLPPVIEPAAGAREWIGVILDCGADPVVEHGVITAEILGLEVARVIPSDLAGWTLAVGVGHHDREAHRELHPEEPPGEALTRVGEVVRGLRVAGASRHPANILAPERWLRSVIVAHPSIVGADSLLAVADTLPRSDLRQPALAAASGRRADGRPIVVACSTGVDLNLVPAAADVRFATGGAGSTDAELFLVLPDGDDYEITRHLADRLDPVATVVTVARDWRSLMSADG